MKLVFCHLALPFYLISYMCSGHIF